MIDIDMEIKNSRDEIKNNKICIDDLYKEIYSVSSTLKKGEEPDITIYNEYDRVVDCNYLCWSSDIAFVKDCYKKILKREPSSEEIFGYVEQLIEKKIDKFDVLDIFITSDELKNSSEKVKVIGYDEHVKTIGYRIKKIMRRNRLLRYIVRWFKTIVYLPKRIEALEKENAWMKLMLESKER